MSAKCVSGGFLSMCLIFIELIGCSGVDFPLYSSCIIHVWDAKMRVAIFKRDRHHLRKASVDTPLVL